MLQTQTGDYTMTEVRYKAHRLMPYLSKLTMTMPVLERPGIETMCVDQYGRIYYDPVVLGQWTLEECAAVLLHEVMHYLLRHHEVVKMFLGEQPSDKKFHLWNIATDLVINQTLRQTKSRPDPNDQTKVLKVTLPEGCYLPEKYGFDTDSNMTAIEYYRALEEQGEEEPPPQGDPQGGDPQEGDSEEPQSGDGPSEEGESEPQSGEAEGEPEAEGEGEPQGGGSGSGDEEYTGPKPPFGGSAADGKERPWEQGPPSEEEPGLSENERDMVERQVARDIKEHDEKNVGDVAGNLARHAEEIIRPKVNPLDELTAACRFAVNTKRGYGDYTWAKPNHRQPTGMRLPAYIEPTPLVTVIVDTSGSMSTKELGQALGVVGEVVNDIPEGVTVVTGDVCKAECDKVFRPEQVVLAGGRGTDMGRIVEDVMDDRNPPDAVIVITDGWTPWPCQEIDAEMVVCLTESGRENRVPDWAKLLCWRTSNG